MVVHLHILTWSFGFPYNSPKTIIDGIFQSKLDFSTNRQKFGDKSEEAGPIFFRSYREPVYIALEKQKQLLQQTHYGKLPPWVITTPCRSLSYPKVPFDRWES